MKFERTPLEMKLLDMLNEINSDIQSIKRKSDPVSHRNKSRLKVKVKVIQNELNIFKNQRREIQIENHSFPMVTENIKYERKIKLFVKNFNSVDS